MKSQTARSMLSKGQWTDVWRGAMQVCRARAHLVLVEEDEGGGRAEVRVLELDDTRGEQVNDEQVRALLLEQ